AAVPRQRRGDGVPGRGDPGARGHRIGMPARLAPPAGRRRSRRVRARGAGLAAGRLRRAHAGRRRVRGAGRRTVAAFRVGALNRPWHRFALALFVLLGSGLFVAWWLHTYERVSREVPLPPAGEAAYNPLYALRLALRADGVEAVSRQRLDLAAQPPGERDTVLVLGDPGTLAPRDVEALLDWVEGGGHLLVSTPRGRRLSGAQAGALLPRIGIEVRPGSSDCARMFVPGEQSHVEFCQGNRFVTRGIDPEYAWGDFAAGFAYARLRRGAGAVDVLASFDFMENGKLAEAPHAALTRQLLDRNYDRGTVHLVYAASMPPLWRLLMERAWMAWLPLALALAAFLWMRLQRVGPVLPRPDDERRSLLE